MPFPLKGVLSAGTTHVEVQETIADAADVSCIDTQLRVKGHTLANLYPFLLLPLPASPTYRMQGHLVLKGKRYAMDDLTGQICSTDRQPASQDRSGRRPYAARLEVSNGLPCELCVRHFICTRRC